MSVQHTTVDARAEISLAINRDASGDLLDGVREQLGRIDGVAGVEEVSVHGVRPGMNDLRVDATADLRMYVREGVDPDRADDAALADRLEGGFGVESATVDTGPSEPGDETGASS